MRLLLLLLPLGLFAEDKSKENSNIEISDEELKQAYEAYLLTIPAGRKRVSHLMIDIDNYETLQEFTDKVNSLRKVLTASNFEDYVLSDSEDVATVNDGGDLGFTDGTLLPARLEEVIAGLDVNEIGSTYWKGKSHFLKVTEIEEPIVLSFDEKLQDLRDELEANKLPNDDGLTVIYDCTYRRTEGRWHPLRTIFQIEKLIGIGAYMTVDYRPQSIGFEKGTFTFYVSDDWGYPRYIINGENFRSALVHMGEHQIRIMDGKIWAGGNKEGSCTIKEEFFWD